MIVTEKTTKTLCDCCGKEFVQYSNGDYLSHKIVKIVFDVWYNGIYQITDICQDCNLEVMKFLHEKRMLGNIRKVE